MIGAIIGDIAGSRFEWNNIKTKDFEMFSNLSRCTDDSIMSIAVAKAIMDCRKNLRDIGTNPTFDRRRIMYIYANGHEQKLLLNQHL